MQKCSLNLSAVSLKLFPKEDELKTKSARLNELNAELNIDERTPIEKAADTNEKTSVIEKLRNTVPVASAQKKNIDFER